MINEKLLKDNKYFKWYWSICNKAKNRSLPDDVYIEKHHIYPKSIFGANNFLVKLTAKEHYIVHLLLWWGFRFKFGTKDENTRKMAYAFTMMNNYGKSNKRYKIKNSNEYSFIKLAYSEARKNKLITEETRTKISNYHKNRPYDHTIKLLKSRQETRNNKTREEKIAFSEKMKLVYSNIPLEEKLETSKKISLKVSGENNGMYNKNHTDESKKLISNARKEQGLSKGDKNPLYGKTAYDIWIEKYGIIEAKIRQAEQIRKCNETKKKKKNKQLKEENNHGKI